MRCSGGYQLVQESQDNREERGMNIWQNKHDQVEPSPGTSAGSQHLFLFRVTRQLDLSHFLIMSYVILGRAVKTEYLALGTLFSTVALTMGLSGGSKEAKPTTLQQIKETVKMDAGSKDEEELFDSIRKFVADAEKESKH